MKMVCGISKSVESFRNLAAFWIFGVTSNFAFTVSIGAAEDILDTANTTVPSVLSVNETQPHQNYLICNPIGTGAVLLSAILPEIIMKLAVQFSPKEIPYPVRLFLTLCFQSAAFILLAVGHVVWLRILGVVCASIATGLGESTFLPLCSFYSKESVTAWSFGTGTAGVLGTLLYAGLTSLGVPVYIFLLSMLAVPAFMLLTYILILGPSSRNHKESDGETIPIKGMDNGKNTKLNLKQKFVRVPSVIKYVISLGSAYFLVYFANQGLAELLYFNGQVLSRLEQYRWYQVLYRIGAFISRLPFNKVKVNNLWLLPLILFTIVCILIAQLYERFIPYLWIVMVLLFLNGIVHGTSYICTFMHVTEHVDFQLKEFALAFVSLAGPIGIVLAGLASVPFHNYICSLHIEI